MLSMLFKSINPEPKLKDSESSKKVNYNSPVKLQCIICTDIFDINTEHNCLLRSCNEEFILKFRVR